MNAPAQIRGWLNERLDLDEMTEPLRSKTVPQHRYSYWYFLGGITLFLFGIQVVTGLLLLLYYRPSTKEAYESVQFITNRVQFGWLVRSLHSWSANLMIFTAFVHMFSVAFLRAYRKPRELTWISGMALLVLCLGFGFSGYLLPWNTLSFFATKVGTEVAGLMPVLGHPIKVFIRGGEDVGPATLSRFFALHVVVLPGLIMGMLGLHLWLVQKFGMSEPPSVEKAWDRTPAARREVQFFPNFFLRDAIAWCGVLAVLLALAALRPSELGTKADPFSSAPAGIRPEWYFLAQFQTLRLLPAHIWHFDGELVGVIGFSLAATVWFSLPFVERYLGKNSPLWVRVLGIVAVGYLGSLTLYAYFAK